jgi:uncharacterized membrane protein YgdD (TMEM256/DUF423 family)
MIRISTSAVRRGIEPRMLSLLGALRRMIRSNMEAEGGHGGKQLTSPARISATIGLLGVVFGAFGAHGLEARLMENATLDIWETAVLYHLVHAIMMFVVATRPDFHKGAWISFLIGVLLFSGSLYVLALTKLTWLGAITPLGGVTFLVGWGWLIWKPSGHHRP